MKTSNILGLAALSAILVIQPAMAESLRPKGNPASQSNGNVELELAAPYYPKGFGRDEILSFLTDLNDDADYEEVIELGSRYCKWSGCRVLILQDDGTSDRWRVVFDKVVSRIDSLDKKTNGWADLKVVSGQWERIYIYDGVAYVLGPQQ